MTNNQEYRYTYITNTPTTTIFSGKGTLKRIVVNTTTNDIVRIVDNNTGTTANVGILPASATVGSYDYDIGISKGLIIDQGNTTGNLTIVWAKG